MIDVFLKETRFKETTGGRLPVDWKDYTLEEVSKEFISGGTPSTKKPEFWNGNIPWIRSVHLTRKYIDQSSVEQFITEKGLKRSAAKIVPRNSLIVATRVGVGKSALTLIDVAINQDLTGIVLDRSKVDGAFVVWYLHTPKVLKLLDSFSRGTTIKGITQLSLKRLPIPCPPVIEQQNISKVLFVVDEIIWKAGEIIAKTERLKKGLMQELLTKGIRHKQFKDTEIGRIPKDWSVSMLGDVALEVYRYPTYYKISYLDEGIPEVRGELIKGNGELESDLGLFRFISQKTSQRFPRTILKEGDFVLSVRGTMGKVAIVPKKLEGANITANLIRISLNPAKCYPPFFKQFFLSGRFQKTLRNLSSQTTIRTIQAPKLKSIKVQIPSVSEQQKISEILCTVDDKLELERNEKSKLERIKQGLMDLLLTGKVRVRAD